MTSPLRIAVCVMSYRRPVWLARLLEGLSKLTFVETPTVRIVVVENEADGPAREVCEQARGGCSFPVEHYAEPSRGIPFARNRAVACAGRDVDFIAFIDDDETPEPQWLQSLIDVQQACNADIVAGPVLPCYEGQVPAWITQGRFHERRRLPTGSAVTPMGTGNVLVRREVFEQFSPPFDERYALIGGSDAHFFRRAVKAGFRAVWADEAIVHEWVPASRASARWIWQRAFRSGTNFALTTWKTERPVQAVGQIAWRTAKHLGWGIVGMPWGLIRGRAGLVSQGQHISRGAGVLLGALGYQYPEYRQIHGR